MVDSEPLHNGNGYSNNANSRFSYDSATPVVGSEQDTDNYNQQKIIAGLLRYKWLIIFALLAGGVAAWYYTDNITPEYQASGTIMIHRDTDESFGGGGGLNRMLNRSLGPEGTGTMENHVQLLRSRIFAERVANKIMEQEVMSNGETFPVLMRENQEGETAMATQSQIVSALRSNSRIGRVSGSDDLIEVSYNSTDPFQAKELVNLFIDEFVERSNENARNAISSTLEYLENDMLSDVSLRLEQSERAIENFMRNEPGGVDLNSHTNRLLNQLTAMEVQIEENELELESIQNRRARLENELNDIEPGLADQMKLATTSRVQMLQENMANLTIERMLILNRNPILREDEEQEPRLKEINREMKNLSAEIDELVTDGLDQTRGFLFTEAGEINSRILELKRMIADYDVETMRIQALMNLANQRIAEYEAQLEQLPQQQLQRARLERNRERNERMYNELASRAFEMGLLEQSTRGSGRVFEHALEPSSPFYPNRNQNIIIGLLLGLGLSIGGVLMRVMLDHRIDSIDLLKRSNLPVLSVIPEMQSIIKSQFKGKTHYKMLDRNLSTLLITMYDPITNVSESFRRLFNNLRFNNPDSRNKIFVMTSPGKGEGKTTAIANLAVTIGESGRRVLLMDCDFRKPNVNRMFGISKEPGITNYLFDDTPLDELIVSAQAPGLDILPTGAQTISPDRVINSEKMRYLIEELSEKYDYILIDTAPFGIISDAAPLIRMADGVIALVRFNKTKTPELEQLLENLKTINAEVMGTILNDFNPKVASGYYAHNKKYTYNDKVYKSYNTRIHKPGKESAKKDTPVHT